MRIDKIVKEATLERFVIDDYDIVSEYGDELQFYSYPDLALDAIEYIDGNTLDIDEIKSILKNILLDNNGCPVITDGYRMPNKVMLSAYNHLKQSLIG